MHEGFLSAYTRPNASADAPRSSGMAFAYACTMNARIDPTATVPAPPFSAPAAMGWRAELDLGFELRGARTVMVRRRHLGPLRVQKPLYPEGDAICHAIVLHPPAGIVGGDSLKIDIALAAGSHALLTTPGAGKWYRSAGARASMVQRLTVAAGAICEWLPQESIVFDGAIGGLSTEVDLAKGARFVGAEMLCFGRTGSGERFDRGAFTMHTALRVDGRPVWLERGTIVGNSPLLDSPVGLAGQPVTGTLLVVGPEVDEAMRDACRAIAPIAGEGAVTLCAGVLVARYLGPGCEPGREWLERLWAGLRPVLTGLPMRAPRIWAT